MHTRVCLCVCVQEGQVDHCWGGQHRTEGYSGLRSRGGLWDYMCVTLRAGGHIGKVLKRRGGRNRPAASTSSHLCVSSSSLPAHSLTVSPFFKKISSPHLSISSPPLRLPPSPLLISPDLNPTLLWLPLCLFSPSLPSILRSLLSLCRSSSRSRRAVV